MATAILYKNEIYRKLIHLSSLWIPTAVYFLDEKNALLLFGFMAAFVFLGEFTRQRIQPIFSLLDRIFGTVLRPEEKIQGGTMTGAAYMMLGTLACLFFSKEIAVTSLAVLMLSDTAAAIVGMKFGKMLLFGKSLEGSVAFLLSGLTVLVTLDGTIPHGPHYLPSGTAAIIAATFVELCSKKMRIDDNLSIPVVICAVMWILR